MAEYTQTYWNELMDKYRNGTISENDRFQLEKQALDDPFLFDALEGFTLYEGEQKEEKEERKATKIFTLPRIAMAASVLFLVAVMFNLNSNKSAQLESDKSIAMVLDGDEDEVNTEVMPEINNEAEVEADEAVISTTEEDVEVESSLPSKDVKPIAAAAQENGIDNKSNIEQKESSPIASKATQDYAKVKNEGNDRAENENKESADLIDEKLGEIVSVTSEPALEEESISQVPKESVEIVGAANFENTRQKDKIEIVIADSDLDMVKSESVKKKRAKVSSFYKAVPVIGKEIFDDFAKESIDKRGLRQEKPQEVTIEFTIDKNGNLTDFHHIFTGCPECGPYAISLLQKSGEWKTVPPGFFGKARYTFIF